ncbi:MULTISPECIES: hypothetical protein [unclassified Microbacterium]|uniref:hypothetical protein n=1 Tax=unclassified Microbacterium TaxID=2609290 RepID=UPI00214B70BE|nr:MULTISPECIES: hypothetical protein [unclassified Microbacterium]MCR2785440.1 hypothetical protein [Microbacterium sp. zg.B96]WIM14533.1 hypothetical protein QNO11_08060 [Microbacterium sp. zg-B96]
MTVSKHIYSAKVTSSVPIVVAPSYSYSYGWETEDATWEVFGNAYYTERATWALIDGAWGMYLEGASDQTGGVRRTFNDLTPGRTYTASIRVRSALPNITLTLAGTPLPLGGGLETLTATFVATSSTQVVDATLSLSGGDFWYADIDTFTLTADALTATEIDLTITSGSISLDAGRAPHVTGDLEVPIPGTWLTRGIPDPLAVGSTLTVPQWKPFPGALDALDPRNKPRVAVTTGDGTNTRTFNLAVRDRAVNHGEGSVSLALASDEALLEDYAPLTDDSTPYAHQASLRAVCNYVLGEAGLGTLAASPSIDRNVTAATDSTNMLIDPGTAASSGGGYGAVYATLDANDTSWSISGDGDSFNLWAPTGSDSYLTVGPQSGMAFGMTKGRRYRFSATGNVKGVIGGEMAPEPSLSGGMRSRSRALVVHIQHPGGYYMYHSTQVPNTVGAATRVWVDFPVPQDATAVFLRSYLGGTSGQIRWDGFRLSETPTDPTDVQFWDGDTTDTSIYNYAWTGGQDNSVSTRTALVERAPDMLLWRAGVSAMKFLHPILQAQGLRLVCDENRVWTLRDETYEAPGDLNLRQGIHLIEAEESISRDDDSWFDARVTRYKWTDADGQQQERVDAYALPGYSRVSTVEVNAAYPGPGRSEYAVRRAQGRGREVTVATVSDWTARAEQPLQVVLTDTPAQLGNVQAVTFDLSQDRMRVSARTIDTPAGAINLLPGTVDALPGTVNSL